MTISPRAGKPAGPDMLVDVPRLVTAYFSLVPDPSVPAQRVAFGTSGHRGSALDCAFNEWHILAICQAICRYRKQQHIDGPLFLGMDTHALSIPARPSGTEDTYKIYAESFRGPDHLQRVLEEAEAIVGEALAGA